MEGSWGYFQQGSHDQQMVSILGAELSKVIHCPVHWPAYDKGMFACKCNILFPTFIVQGAHDIGDWSKVIKLHEEGRRSDEG